MSTAIPRLIEPASTTNGLLVSLLEVARHHRPILRRLDDRPGDQVREADLHPALLEDPVERLALGVERVDRERPERGRRRYLPAFVHRLGERGGGAAQSLGLAIRSRGLRSDSRGRAIAVRGEHVGLGHLAAWAGALDAREIHTRCGCGAASYRRGFGVSVRGTVGGFAISRHVLSFASRRAGLRRGSGGRISRVRCRSRVALGHRAQWLAHFDRLVGAYVDLRQRSAERSGHLGVDLVRGDLDERLALLDGLTLGDVPLEHGSLGNAFAHLGHLDVDRLAARRFGFAIGRLLRTSRHVLSFASGRAGLRRRFGGRIGGVGFLRCAAVARPCVLVAAGSGVASPFESMSARGLPTSIVSSGPTWILVMTPSEVAGTSASTLSVETSTIVWPSSTESPSATSHSSTVPSVTDSPISGIRTCTVALVAIPLTTL